MTDPTRGRPVLHARRGGDPDGPVLLLLHGLGATAAVWDGLAELLPGRWPGQWVAPDLAGHGRSGPAADYTFATFAADVAALLPPDRPVTVVGHSMGGVVALALAGGTFGVPVTAAIALGVKVAWTGEELEAAHAYALRPARLFDDEDAAIARYLRVAGLEGLVEPGSPLARGGVTRVDGGYRLAADPRTALVGEPDMARLIAGATCRVVLARGEKDAMVTTEQLRALHPDTVVLDGLGHNAHVEAPARLMDLLAEVAPA